MGRPLRLHLPGGFYHVTLRGNHRQRIFFDESDYALLEHIASETTSKLHTRVHTFCWMTNHLHLLMQVSDAPLGAVIRRMASRFARTVQLRLNTTGHLFERRYHAALVDADEYLLTLIRYIHLNPVRAGLVNDPASYRWSSHNTYLGYDHRSWVSTDFALQLFGAQPDVARAEYAKFVGAGDSSLRDEGMVSPHPEHPQILGNDEFVARVKGSDQQPCSRKSLEELVTECCVRFGVAPEELSARMQGRELAAPRAWIAHEAEAGQVASVCAIARRLGRTEGAIRQLMMRHPRVREAR